MKINNMNFFINENSDRLLGDKNFQILPYQSYWIFYIAKIIHKLYEIAVINDYLFRNKKYSFTEFTDKMLI